MKSSAHWRESTRVNAPANTPDPELDRLLAQPEFLTEPVFSQQLYLAEVAHGLFGHFLRALKQGEDVFKTVQQAHADSNSNCLKAMAAIGDQKCIMVGWTFDLDSQGPQAQSGRGLFTTRSKPSHSVVPTATEIREHVLGRRVLRIQVASSDPNAKLPGEYQVCQLKNIGWYGAALIMPTQRPMAS
jgi:hypothetical protein